MTTKKCEWTQWEPTKQKPVMTKQMIIQKCSMERLSLNASTAASKVSRRVQKDYPRATALVRAQGTGKALTESRKKWAKIATGLLRKKIRGLLQAEGVSNREISALGFR